MHSLCVVESRQAFALSATPSTDLHGYQAELAEELESAPEDYIAYTLGFKIEAIGARVGSRKSHRSAAMDAGQLEPLVQVQMNLTEGQAVMRQRNKTVTASVGRLHVENLPANGSEDQFKRVAALNFCGSFAAATLLSDAVCVGCQVLWAEEHLEQSGVPLLAVEVDLNPLPAKRPNLKQALDLSIDVKLQRLQP